MIKNYVVIGKSFVNAGYLPSVVVSLLDKKKGVDETSGPKR